MESSDPFTIAFRVRAAKEYLEAIAWYNDRSLKAAEYFTKSINEALLQIEEHPDHYRKSYKQFHEFKLRKYPYSIIYFIDVKKSVIVVTTIFHHKRNPLKKYPS